MRSFVAICLALVSLGAVPQSSAPVPPIYVKLGPALEIGREGLLFGSIVSVCEDAKGDFYVLDQRERTVLKFAPDGRELMKFGRKGQGPGDFQSPREIAFTPQKELAVLEDIHYVSFHRTDGAFLRRVDLNGRLGMGFVGPECYYAWAWRPGSRQQLLVDAKNTVLRTLHSVDRDLFSANLPDETGRLVMFNYSDDAYVPRFLFAHGAGLSAVGKSDRYEFEILDEQGRVDTVIRRDMKPRKISAQERRCFERKLLDFTRSKRWPDSVARALRKKIPAFKTLIQAVRISPKAILIFHQPDDVTAEALLIPVDVFARTGEFLGTTEIPEIPLFVSGNAMYFSRADADGNLYLVRRDYSF